MKTNRKSVEAEQKGVGLSADWKNCCLINNTNSGRLCRCDALGYFVRLCTERTMEENRFIDTALNLFILKFPPKLPFLYHAAENDWVQSFIASNNVTGETTQSNMRPIGVLQIHSCSCRRVSHKRLSLQ